MNIVKTTLLVAISSMLLNPLFASEDFPSVKEEFNSNSPMKQSIVEDGPRNKVSVDPEHMSDYRVDSCQVKYDHISNEDTLRKNQLRRCKDGTVSFVQPDSEGWFGAEGKCGQTSVSNIVYMFCKRAAHPKAYVDRYLSDITPGVRPGTLSDGLNDIFSKLGGDCPNVDWDVETENNETNYINRISSSLKVRQSLPNTVQRTRKNGAKVYRKPVSLLIRVPNSKKGLHWVTAVDLVRKGKSCNVFINHWDDQYKVPCHLMAKWSRGVGASFGLILDSYTIVKAK
ncbi:MAG: hypothetical protein KC493_07595 [Bacteriovoracaceae bacterium]|nr:hypothetical protein [Bacteriovoracaceae bacterium]